MDTQAIYFEQISILYIIIAFLVGLLIKDFLSNYVKRKAEYLATKEDIEQITKQVESIRTDFEINSYAHKSYVGDRKDSLIRFYDEISSFYYEMLAVNFGDFPMDGGKSLFEYQQSYYKSTAEIIKSYQRLVIYFPEGLELLKIAHEITTNVIECRKILKNHFGDIKTTAIGEEEAYTNIEFHGRDKYERAVKISNEAYNEYWALMRANVESFQGMYQTYLSELNIYLRGSEINA
ncbi:MAG: hypothetical protein AB2800_09715 [Candidatus Thiodiazotropha endolucinida]